MKVRCWLLVGSHRSASDLPQTAFAGHWHGPCPESISFDIGHWIVWDSHGNPVVLVCAEVLLG